MSLFARKDRAAAGRWRQAGDEIACPAPQHSRNQNHRATRGWQAKAPTPPSAGQKPGGSPEGLPHWKGLPHEILANREDSAGV